MSVMVGNDSSTMFMPLTINGDPIRNMELPSGVRSEGWVYVLSNEFMPGIFKIGMTTHEPEERATQISQGTGIPAPFIVKAAYFSANPRGDEEKIHQHLSECRINPNREFFKCSFEEVDEAFYEIGLVARESRVEEIADRFDVICLEKDSPYSIDELFDYLDLDVFGCRYAALKRLVEIAKMSVDALQKRHCSLVLHDGFATPIVREFIQQREAHQKLLDEAGAYGPKKPGGY
ncbi:GIY-YIG nuclease family protein [Pectobacterium odoriferum]|uniref:GIY-YIG nuclease family protein n=1 Tax=Pectobacterium odoriferum TaxID=78398 RepID=UPI0032F061A6